MFEKLRNFFTGDTDTAKGTATFAADESQIAEAALMFHVIAADGVVTEDEKAQLSQSVSTHFGLSAKETEELIRVAKQADNEAIDLYRFTSTLKRELDYDARLELIENLWRMVYADGIVHELEDNIVWRVAELLEVNSRDRMLLKQRVNHEDDAGE